MLNYNDYTYINYIFETLNENLTSNINKFIFKIMDTVSKLKDIKVLRYFNNKLNNYISNIKHKNRQVKHFAINAFIWGILLNPNYNMINDYLTPTNTNKETSSIKDVYDKEKIEMDTKAIKIERVADNYKKMADIYLNRVIFENSPITEDMLSKAAKKTYKKYGIWVPLELVLAQAQLESHMGTKGRSSENNPFNVGEFDSGTKIEFSSTQEGIDAYYKLIAKDYLSKDKNLNTLLDNFVNKNNKRYASNPNYESLLKKQVGFIKRYIKNRLV